MPYRLIDPDEKLDYSCDWATFLDDGGSPSDTISSSSWSITDAGSPAPTLSGQVDTTNSSTIFVEGCTLFEVYRLSNKIVTAQGRTAERTITLRCAQR